MSESWPECEEFYNLMQAYRHAPVVDQAATVEAYEAVKRWLSATTIPEGYVLVPVESTGPMLNAAWKAINGSVGTGTIDDIYDAMIAAAPKAES